LALVHERLSETRKRLERWQTEARLVAETMNSEASRRRRLTDIERVTHQIEALITNQTPASSPLIRVIGALVPRN
jgi:hypothetical protein